MEIICPDSTLGQPFFNLLSLTFEQLFVLRNTSFDVSLSSICYLRSIIFDNCSKVRDNILKKGKPKSRKSKGTQLNF